MKMHAAILGILVLLAFAPAASGKVVNENEDRLPPGCDTLRETFEFTVHGGRDHAHDHSGVVFTFNNRSFELPACAKVTVTFVNDDDIRHQWMVHGAWPDGFFLIEVDGGEQDTGTFITGSEPETLLIHCGLPQHQQKGMKGQVLVAGGVGNLPNIVGVSGTTDEVATAGDLRSTPPATPLALILVLGSIVHLRRRSRDLRR